jgi:hypothetical protein
MDVGPPIFFLAEMWYYSSLMNRIGRFLIPVLLALFLSGCQDHRAKTASLPSPELEQEEYNVYSSLLNRDSDAKDDEIALIFDYTEIVPIVDTINGYSLPSIFRTRDYIPGFDGKIYIAEIGEDTLRDFEQKNQHRSPLNYKFDLKSKILLFSNEELWDIMREEAYWYKLSSKYPNSRGIFTFSRVGFNQTRDKAIVYQHWYDGGRANSGHIILLYKVNGVWTLKKAISLWLS